VPAEPRPHGRAAPNTTDLDTYERSPSARGPF